MRTMTTTIFAMALVLVACKSASSEVLFDPPSYVGSWELPANPEPDYTALAVAQDGSVWVADRVSMIHVRDGDVVGGFDLPNRTEYPLIDRITELDDGRLCLLDRGTHHVWVLQSDGSVSESWSAAMSGALNGDTDPSGLVYLVDERTVGVFDLSGQLVRSWEIPAASWSLSVGPDGRVFILYDHPDSWQYVHVFSPEGELLANWRWAGAYSPSFSAGPTGTVLFHWGDWYQRRSLAAYGPEGVSLWEWQWSEPIPEDSCREPSDALGEDAAGRLYWVTRDICDPPPPPYSYPPRIEIYEPSQTGIMVQPDHHDVRYTVDGVSYTGRQRFLWAAGTEHQVAAYASTTIAPGTRRDFASWSDGGARVHTVTAAPWPLGLALKSQTFHFLETVVDSGGTATASGWVPESTEVVLEAHNSLGYRFVKWGHPDSTGWQPTDVLYPYWTHTVVGPERWEACFVRRGIVLSISASATDPWMNEAAPTMGPRQLFLFATCLDHGMSGIQSDVTGSIPAGSFVPADGVFNIGQGPNLLCTVSGCPIGTEVNFLLGSWLVWDLGGDFCLGPTAADGVLAVADCPWQQPRAWTPTVVGFSSIGDPCITGPLCGADSLVPDPSDAPIDARPSAAPAVLGLSSRGNPFRSSVEMALDLPKDGHAELRVYDVAGRLVRTLLAGEVAAGRRVIAWDGRDGGGALAPSGIYFVRLEAVGDQRTTKVVRVAP